MRNNFKETEILCKRSEVHTACSPPRQHPSAPRTALRGCARSLPVLGVMAGLAFVYSSAQAAGTTAAPRALQEAREPRATQTTAPTQRLPGGGTTEGRADSGTPASRSGHRRVMLSRSQDVAQTDRPALPAKAAAQRLRRPIQQASLVDDEGTRARESNDRRRRRLESLAPPMRKKNQDNETGDAAAKAVSKSVKVFGAVSAQVYVFESDRSLTPDFQASGASLGVEGSQGPWQGKAEVSLAEKSQSLGIANAYIGFSPFAGHEWRLGRISLAGVDAYVADLNHHPSGLGIADGVTLAQKIEPLSWMSLNLGAGVANSLAEDVTFEFKSRAAGSERALFGWATLGLGALKVQGTYGYQPDQIRVKDKSETADFNEQRQATASTFELSVGLDFTYLSLGGFYGLKDLDAERYSVPGQTPPSTDSTDSTGTASAAPPPLTGAWDTQTAGAGITLKTPVAWSQVDDEEVGLRTGFSVSDTAGDTAEKSEEIIGATLYYSMASASFSLSYGYLSGKKEQKYQDPVTKETFRSADRVSVGASYSF